VNRQCVLYVLYRMCGERSETGEVTHREITINQLQFIVVHLCGRRKEDLTMKLLTPAELNLYHIKEKIIKLRTAAW
jgi:hypothetical protein